MPKQERLKYAKLIYDNLGCTKEEILEMNDERFERILNLAELAANEEHWYEDGPEEQGPYGGAFRDEQHYWEYRGIKMK